MRRLIPWIALAAVVIGFANFFWVWIESATIGDALQGRIEDGRYLLVNKGVATEVSREAWEWSRFHASSVFLTHLLAITGLFYLLMSTWPQIVGVSLAGAADRVSRIRSSGEVIATERIGARIGSMQFTAPLVRAEVMPGGLVLHVFGSGPIGIEARSIVKVVVDEGRFSGRWVRIVHREAGVPADIRLYLQIDHPLVEAVGTLTASAPADDPRVTEATLGSEPEPYPMIFRVAIVLGLALSVVLIAVGVVVVVPRIGSFGLIWTIALVLITATNVYRYVIRGRDRW